MQYRSNSEGHNECGDLVPKVLRWVRSYCLTKIQLKHNNPTPFPIATLWEKLRRRSSIGAVPDKSSTVNVIPAVASPSKQPEWARRCNDIDDKGPDEEVLQQTKVQKAVEDDDNDDENTKTLEWAWRGGGVTGICCFVGGKGQKIQFLHDACEIATFRKRYLFNCR
jgi:hypothetical protein